MTTSHSNSISETKIAQDSAISQNNLSDNLDNTLSLWQELRLTSMSGADHLFVPNFILDSLDTAYALSRFVEEVCTEFCIEPLRLRIIGIGTLDDEYSFSRNVIEWHAGCICHSHHEKIETDTKYHTYIESMYQFSSALVSPTEH